MLRKSIYYIDLRKTGKNAKNIFLILALKSVYKIILVVYKIYYHMKMI